MLPERMVRGGPLKVTLTKIKLRKTDAEHLQISMREGQGPNPQEIQWCVFGKPRHL